MTDRLLTAEALATALLARANTPARIALTKQEAAAAIGVSLDFFEQHVQPELAVVRQGRKVLVPVAELGLGERAGGADAAEPSRRRKKT